MIVKKLLLLGFGVVLIAGCQPSRSQDAHLPISPQLSKVQTPVLHAMPVRGQLRTSSQWVWQDQSPSYSSLGTYTSSPTYLVNPSELQQSVAVTAAQAPVSSTQMIPLQPLGDQGNRSRKSLAVLPSPQPVENSSWIQEVKTVELSSIDQAGFARMNDSLSQTYTLELLDVDALVQSSDAVGTISDAPVIVEESAITPVNELPAEPVVLPTLFPTSPPLPIRQPVDQWISTPDVYVPAAKDVVESEDVGVVAMPQSQTFTNLDAMIITTNEDVSVAHQAAGQALPEFAMPQVVELQRRPDSYVTQKGDTLWSIAKRFYGNGQQWKLIARYNLIHRPDRMTAGVTLQLP